MFTLGIKEKSNKLQVSQKIDLQRALATKNENALPYCFTDYWKSQLDCPIGWLYCKYFIRRNTQPNAIINEDRYRLLGCLAFTIPNLHDNGFNLNDG